MPRMCQICQKTALAGNIVSHANNKTHTKSQPNLQKVSAGIEGTVQKISVCTRSMRTATVIKAA
jgi:large subunit ribosomal protein L28